MLPAEIEHHLLALADHEQLVVWIGDRPFLIQPATDSDVERINKGYFCMD
ncbi:hypothetical protein [Paenibacillus sp. A3]|nr:hypothetical protein [Paenibacillus sp. A3]